MSEPGQDIDPSSAAAIPGLRHISHRLVWALACLPLVSVPINLCLQWVGRNDPGTLVICQVLMSFLIVALILRLMALDRRMLRESGLDTTPLSLWWVLFLPVWFYRRGTIAKKKGPGWVFFMLWLMPSCVGGAIGGYSGAVVDGEISRANGALQSGQWETALESARKIKEATPTNMFLDNEIFRGWLRVADLIVAQANRGLAAESWKKGDVAAARSHLAAAAQAARDAGEVGREALENVGQDEAAMAQAEMTAEATPRAGLEKLRTALKSYRENHGSFPNDLSILVSGGLIEAIPAIQISPHHPLSAEVHNASGQSKSGPEDTGGWGYFSDPSSPDFGGIFVNCTHKDASGKFWDSY